MISRLLKVTPSLRPIGIVLGVFVALVAMIVTTGGWAGSHVLASQSESASPVRSADFEEDGSIRLPVDYRQWEHVGTRIKPDGSSVLDGSQITTPQVMDTYIAPTAFNSFKKNGIWPDGTQIVKEISLIRTGKDCDKVTFVCSTSFGSGIFQASYIGMGMMVKDSKRFPVCARQLGLISHSDQTGRCKPSHCHGPPSAAVRVLPHEALVEYGLRLFEHTHWAVTGQFAIATLGLICQPGTRDAYDPQGNSDFR